MTNRLLRAHGFTGAAVNAFVWVDVHHPVALVDAIYGALLDARLIQYIYATLGNHVSQGVATTKIIGPRTEVCSTNKAPGSDRSMTPAYAGGPVTPGGRVP